MDLEDVTIAPNIFPSLIKSPTEKSIDPMNIDNEYNNNEPLER
jgi:hypothetical protein